MKQYILMLFCVFSFSSALFAQNATDFTTDDCNGISHSLFDSLDAGNVIVIAWVMPCGACAIYGKYAYDAAYSFALSHPGRVDFYLVDDYANTSCSNLVNWGNSNQMPLNTAFSTSAISMSDYGDNGMPKVVVLGGVNHSVYYNMNDNQINFIDVQSAINTALGSPSYISEHEEVLGLSTFPNPTNGLLNINYEVKNLNSISFEIVNVLGENLLSIYEGNSFSLGARKKIIDISSLETGVYFLNIYSGFKVKTTRFIVSS